MSRFWTVAVIVFGAGGVADGQFSSDLSFGFPSGSVYSGGASIIVELWIMMNPANAVYALYEWEGDILSDDPTGAWSNLTVPFPPNLPMSVGTPGNGNVVGISVAQLHFPPSGFYANTANPIMIWAGEWSTVDLTPRLVEISTSTLLASAYHNTSGFLTLDVSEALAQIQVIPAPVSLATIALAAFAVRRRRRMAMA